jgi:predicted GNAT superfamily acetyltransferase
MTITIRSLETQEEFMAAEELQAEIWPGDRLEIAPRHVLLTVAHNGGLVLGAFDGQQLIGFLFGFLGTDEADASRPAMTRLKHCSHMLGVLPEYRDQDIGYRLKLAQRDFVMKQGVRLITWTYDPLESRNAHLNIARLGAVCRTYMEDVYGPMADALNAGLASDRFQVEWWITSARVQERVQGQRAKLVLDSFLSAGADILNPTIVAPDDGLPRPAPRPRAAERMFALVEIPYNFQEIKTHDLALARDWRLQTRALFEAAFAQRYLVTDFFSAFHEGRQRSFYALSQSE